MSMQASLRASHTALPEPAPGLDYGLLLAGLALLGLGLVMVASASLSIAERQTGDPFYYLLRQGSFALIGLVLALAAYRLPLAFWEQFGPMLLIGTLAFLMVVLIPGLGHTVNGSTRWLKLGPFNFQVSEMAKLAVIIYLAGYLVRHGEAVRNTVSGFFKPMAVVALMALLLLLEPDFGAAVVLTATALGLMFLGGVRLWLFAGLVLVALALLFLLAVSSPYRMERLTAFMNPWADPFNSGFQLTQALIAFGRGEWWGVGLGGSVQKLFYLPEAHTDFLFAVLGEELGLSGIVLVVLLFGYLVWRIFCAGRAAFDVGEAFAGFLAYGVAIWIALQAFINMGVNMGLLPTKGLTLPLMSYGGSSMIVTCIALALVLRVSHECALKQPRRMRR